MKRFKFDLAKYYVNYWQTLLRERDINKIIIRQIKLKFIFEIQSKKNG